MKPIKPLSGNLRTAVSSSSKVVLLFFAAIVGFLNTTSAGVKPAGNDTSAATLNSLRFSPAITTTTVPGANFRDYTATVSNDVNSVTVTPTVTDPAATVKVNGTAVASGTASAPITLNVGNNTITTVVTGSDGVTTATYSTVITRQGNAMLSSLTFTPDLERTTVPGPDFRDFTATVGNYISSVRVTPVTVDPAATVKVNGTTVASGASSSPIGLAVGSNTIVIKVTSVDNLTYTYKITITRQGTAVATLNSLTFNPAITRTTVPGPHFKDYTATVPNTISTIKVKPIVTDPVSTVTVNGVATASGAESAPIALTEGDNVIRTVVTATDGLTFNVYNTVITRAPAIATLKEIIYSPNFVINTVPGPHYKDYTATVPLNFEAVFVQPVKTDSGETVKVNGLMNSQLIPLTVGKNIITTEVTSADGTVTNVYYLVLNRFRGDASGGGTGEPGPKLSNLYTNPGIGKVAGPHFQDFASTVAANINTIQINFRADPRDIVTINGVVHPAFFDIAQGVQRDASVILPLAYGDNVFSLVVSFPDGRASTTYYIVVTRQPAGTSPLYNSISWVPYFDVVKATGSGADSWTASVPYTADKITQTVKLTEPGSTMKVNGVAVASGATSQILSLNYGLNTITTVITSADGLSSKTLQLVITRRERKPPVLSSIIIDANVVLTQVPGPNFRDYTAHVDSAVSSIHIISTLAYPATNQVLVYDGHFRTKPGVKYGRSVPPGGTVIPITVISPDDGARNTYSLTIFRPHSEKLLWYYPHPNPFDLYDQRVHKVPGPDYEDYEGNVINSVTSGNITLRTEDPSAKITVNGAGGDPRFPYEYSGTINYEVGANVFLVVVTSKDGLHSNTYKLTITRAAPGANASIYIEKVAAPVLDNGIVAVHEGLSPNGDGIADYLVIDGITNHPDNKLTIINKAGTLVYQAKGYDNVLKVFDGRSSINGKLQQAGTYLYKLDYKTEGQLIHKTGYIVIKY